MQRDRAASEPRSGRDNFVVHEMQPDRLGSISVFEVASNGVADFIAKSVEVVRFGENRCANCVRSVPALGGFLDEEQDLGHAAPE